MCGIIGYIGSKEVIPILLEGLHSLEYRGYDSTGIALHKGKRLSIIKSAGKLSNLEEILQTNGNSQNGNNGSNGYSHCGIGHTRWATHGEPSHVNAHPHFDHDGKVAVVHNGIIRNYQEVRERLVKSGTKFISETDTEVTVQLISNNLATSSSILSAICKSVNELEGSYALAILFKDEPDKIYAVRKESPLVIGIGENENYLASDSSTLSRFVDKVIRLGDNEIVELSKGKAEFYTFKEEKIKKIPQVISRTQDFLDKRGFKHYLAKEIHEQPEIISNLLNEHLPNPQAKVQFNKLNLSKDFLQNIDRILILACGTAYHSGLIGKYVLEELVSIPTEVQLASEFLNLKPLLTKKSLVIGISQSGETADTLSAVKKAISTGATFLGITNRPDSALADLAKDNLIISKAGLEVSVAATKTFTSQLMILYLLAVYISEITGSKDVKSLNLIKQELRLIPQLMDQTLTRAEYYQEQIIQYVSKSDFVFIGRGINYPIALEAALKLKELSYIHASGYAAGEMKHGPIAVLDPNVPVVSIAVPGNSYERILQNSLEAKSRNAPMIGVAIDGDKKAEGIFDTVLHTPSVSEFISPFLTIIPLQFLAYYIADHLGCNVDQPRNLAKSVTVE